ncbi:MAG: hypothetical protein R6X02_06675 [Enhygromyxa sp.]
MSTWSSIHQFISRREPAFDRESIPVPLDAIRMTERGLGIRFPQTYVDFLCTAGELSGSYAPFLVRVNTNFYDIVERVSRGTNYPVERYWPGGLRIDIDGDLHDPFIDLARSDGMDAPLVTFEPRMCFDWQEPFDLMYTLAEELAANAFTLFEMERRKSSANFLINPFHESGLNYLELTQLLELTEVVSASPRLRIFEGAGPVAAAIFVWSGNIGVEVASDDPRPCRRIYEVFRDNIPGLCSELDFD